MIEIEWYQKDFMLTGCSSECLTPKTRQFHPEAKRWRLTDIRKEIVVWAWALHMSLSHHIPSTTSIYIPSTIADWEVQMAQFKWIKRRKMPGECSLPHTHMFIIGFWNYSHTVHSWCVVLVPGFPLSINNGLCRTSPRHIMGVLGVNNY